MSRADLLTPEQLLERLKYRCTRFAGVIASPGQPGKWLARVRRNTRKAGDPKAWVTIAVCDTLAEAWAAYRAARKVRQVKAESEERVEKLLAQSERCGPVAYEARSLCGSSLDPYSKPWRDAMDYYGNGDYFSVDKARREARRRK
jgi:hypothetical protein